MKKIIKFMCVAAFVAVAGYGVCLTSKESMPNLLLANIESIAACESIGWWDNDGNCVSNNSGSYFCKSDSWHELTDCLQ